MLQIFQDFQGFFQRSLSKYLSKNVVDNILILTKNILYVVKIEVRTIAIPLIVTALVKSS